MEHLSHMTETNRPARIPPVVWCLGAGLVVAIVAGFIFNVPPGTVRY